MAIVFPVPDDIDSISEALSRSCGMNLAGY